MNPWIRQQLARLDSSISANLIRVRATHSLAELVQLTQPACPPELRQALRASPQMRRLKAAAASRAATLIDGQLESLALLEGDAFDREVHRLLTREWVYVRGYFPLQAQQAHAKLTLLRHKKKSSDTP